MTKVRLKQISAEMKKEKEEKEKGDSHLRYVRTKQMPKLKANGYGRGFSKVGSTMMFYHTEDGTEFAKTESTVTVDGEWDAAQPGKWSKENAPVKEFLSFLEDGANACENIAMKRLTGPKANLPADFINMLT